MLLQVRTMNAVKDMSMKKSYDKRLQKMEADKLASHTHLMQDKEDKTKQMGILEQRSAYVTYADMCYVC